MAKFHLTSWRISWHAATKTHPPYTHVTIHGTAKHLLRTQREIEVFNIPITPDCRKDDKTIKELVKRAMQMSQHGWTGSIHTS